jgi:putative ABC transport system permease protein
MNFRWLSRNDRSKELDEELESHLRMAAEDLVQRGASKEAAMHAARRVFGNVSLVRETTLDTWGGRWWHDLLEDVRYGLRVLCKDPQFLAVAVLTLALGIGANTAIFSVVNAVLLRPLPFHQSDRVVLAWNRADPAAGGDRTPLAVAELFDWRTQSRVFASVSAFHDTFVNYTGGEVPERVRCAEVTTNFFGTLGVNPAQGRTFLPEEERPGTPRVAIISDAFWRKHFAANPQALGRAINLDGESFTIVGVMPVALNFPSRETEIWTAMQLAPPERWGPSWFLTGIGRLKPGVTLAQANMDVRAMKISLGDGRHFNFNLMPVNDYIVGDTRPALLALLIAVTLVLLIAASNVANLTLARGVARFKEISLRTALGANRSRIVRQLLTENLLLAAAGGAIGTIGATWGIGLLRKLAPADIPRLDQVTLDGSALGWTALVTLVTCLIFGLAPAWQSTRLDLNETLKEGGRGATEGVGRQRGRSVLAVVELALAVMLLIGAGLVIKSLWRLQQIDVGINPERVLTMQIPLRGQQYIQPQRARAFCARLLEQVQTLPGVRAAAVSDSLPPGETAGSNNFTIEGRNVLEHEEPVAYFIRVSPDYFRVFGILLRSGRYFTGADTADTPSVVLINETMRRRFFPGEDPIGRRLNLGSAKEPDWEEIVGVVGDVKYNGLADEVQPALYLAVAQAAAWRLKLVLKTDASDPLSLTAAVTSKIRELDPSLPIARVSTMEQLLAAATSQPRFRTTLIALFAALALALACVGIYGVISYSVTQRAHELGTRMAFGAQKRDVLRLVLGQGLRLALTGTGIGLAAAFALTRLLKSLLFGVRATDPLIFGAGTLLLVLVSLLACYLPARHAAEMDPMPALRCE